MTDGLTNDQVHDDVRTRLLDAAEVFFCEKGLDGTSVRDLTQEAGCNVAAVNYHFGSKEKLYEEVFKRRFKIMRDIRITSIEEVLSNDASQDSVEKLFRVFALSFIEPLLEESQGRKVLKLMVREMLDKKLPEGTLMSECIRPVMQIMKEAIRKFYPELPADKAYYSMQSFVAQLIHAVKIQDFHTEQERKEMGIGSLSELVDHIITFTMAGMKNYEKGNQ